jgi:hypothetical protein
MFVYELSVFDNAFPWGLESESLPDSDDLSSRSNCYISCPQAPNAITLLEKLPLHSKGNSTSFKASPTQHHQKTEHRAKPRYSPRQNHQTHREPLNMPPIQYQALDHVSHIVARGLSGGAIVGIALAALFLLLAVGGIMIIFLRG